MAKSLAALKAEAIEMNVEFQEGVTAKELESLIKAAASAAPEATVQEEIVQRVVDVELDEDEPTVVPVATKPKKVESEGEVKVVTISEKIRAAKEAAMKTVVVTVIDNDSRVNNQTTTAPVNCSNRYFDLGTVHIPLNEPVEVMQGHIDVLKDVVIPHHVSDPKTGLSKVVTRKRYTIQYEQQ